MAVSLFNVSNLLVQLLRIHHRVSLPGAGAFVTEYRAAAIINNGKTILPPTKAVAFHTDELWNDGFLETALAAHEAISEEEAKRQLLRFTGEMNGLLREGKRIEFPDFGTLRITADGEYFFEKNADINLLPDAFGLEELELRPVSNERLPQAAVPKQISTTSKAPPLLSPVPPKTESKEKKKKERTRRKNRWYILWITLAVIFIVLATLTVRSIYVFYSSQPAVISLPK